MKGKTQNKKGKKKLIKILILACSFVLTIVVSASVTLAWFYDSDWASNTVTMAGTVGIEMRNDAKTHTTGINQLHFKIDTAYAYPGQSVELQASVFNNGGTSIEEYFEKHSIPLNDENIKKYGQGQVDTNGDGTADYKDVIGSSAYIRAQFVVFTNIVEGGTAPEEPDLSEYDDMAEYLEDMIKYEEDLFAYEEAQANEAFNGRSIYNALQGLLNNTADYTWKYHKNTTSSYQFDGSPYTVTDLGYYYLCVGDGSTKVLKELKVGDTAAYLWNSTFVIPWELTNLSADKEIYIGITFQAVQTYIPRVHEVVTSEEGVEPVTKEWQIVSDYENALENPKYDDTAVQIVFNTSRFKTVRFDPAMYDPATGNIRSDLVPITGPAS